LGQLNQQQTELIKNKAKEIEFEKEAYFSEAGKIPRRIHLQMKEFYGFAIMTMHLR